MAAWLTLASDFHLASGGASGRLGWSRSVPGRPLQPGRPGLARAFWDNCPSPALLQDWELSRPARAFIAATALVGVRGRRIPRRKYQLEIYFCQSLQSNMSTTKRGGTNYFFLGLVELLWGTSSGIALAARRKPRPSLLNKFAFYLKLFDTGIFKESSKRPILDGAKAFTQTASLPFNP